MNSYPSHRLGRVIVIGTALLAAFPVQAAERFQFKEPELQTYLVPERSPRLLSVDPRDAWLTVGRDDGAPGEFQIGSRIVLLLADAASLASLTADAGLSVVERAAPDLFVLQASDPWHAAREAARLAQAPGVHVAQPVTKQPLRLHHPYSVAPNDSYFDQQWHLENRATNGTRLGADINARAAWPFGSGDGVNIAVVDEGVELWHLDLAAAVAGQPHYNFYRGTTDGNPVSISAFHGTAVAGLAAAPGENARGVSGVARHAGIASWIIFEGPGIAGPQALRDMFQYRSNQVQVQNHSWSFSDIRQLKPGALELTGISNAVRFGRGGRGVVMVRSAGNDRDLLVNANDDGYANDPRVITVAAVRRDGLNTSYSNPGACVLVAAPSGDIAASFNGVVTTDLTGAAGNNMAIGSSDFSSYTYFSGTSASAPIVAGIAALILEQNPALSYRDVQQILINAARHTDPADPNLRTNQAGFLVSHNTGFGVPDAGRAVRLAQTWPPRPASTSVSVVEDRVFPIPNQGLRVEVFGQFIPLQLASMIASPGVGPRPEDFTDFRPLVDVGWATTPITDNLDGKAALIRRGINTFREKIAHASAAGAELAIIANHSGDSGYVIMQGTERNTIPAVFINGPDGDALQAYAATNANTHVRASPYGITITNHFHTPLLVEHVSLRIRTDHPRRGDLRIIVESPSGLRSEMQFPNDDLTPGPNGWVYHSTHHFFESSQGVWSIVVYDEMNAPFGNLLETELTLTGVPITDSDRDGLDDLWELQHLETLAGGPADDADFDGESNMREQLAGTDPRSAPALFGLDITPWSRDYLRIGWPSVPGRIYDVLASPEVEAPFNVLTNIPGGVDAGEWFLPNFTGGRQFILIRSRSP